MNRLFSITTLITLVTLTTNLSLAFRNYSNMSLAQALEQLQPEVLAAEQAQTQALLLQMRSPRIEVRQAARLQLLANRQASLKQTARFKQLVAQPGLPSQEQTNHNQQQ